MDAIHTKRVVWVSFLLALIAGVSGISRYLTFSPVSPTRRNAMSVQDQFQSILANQIAMNQGTWKALLAHGLKPESEVELDFHYYAQSKERFGAYLRTETGYAVAVQSSGNWLKRKWWVNGTTKKTKITLEILNQWAEWMVAKGCEHGCTFDGWGTSV